ncbi:MAG: hypothetical protein ABIU05_23195 [Nitrospirales bacterium]
MAERKAMMDTTHALPISRQAQRAWISRVALMKRMAMAALYRKPGTSTKRLDHDVYPYLLLGTPSTGRTKCGRPTRRTFPWPKGLCP